MAVKIRLQRFGSKGRPFYRVVSAESTNRRDGRFLEIIGTYNPLDGVVNVDVDKYKKWVGVGAIPTDTVKSLLKKHKLL
jgi:small subunit ribosomal protein S16